MKPNERREDKEIADTSEARYVAYEDAGVGGERTTNQIERALTLVEKLYRDGLITFDEYSAGGALRNMHFVLTPPTEGVSSYGLGTGGADPTRKGDRKAQRLTGISISAKGSIERGESRNNRSDRWRYQDALFAMAGVVDDEGAKVADPQVVRIMIRAVIDSEKLPTQTEIGGQRAAYASKKQLSAIGASFIRENLRRLAMHLRMVKGEAVR